MDSESKKTDFNRMVQSDKLETLAELKSYVEEVELLLGKIRKALSQKDELQLSYWIDEVEYTIDAILHHWVTSNSK